jgi:hypothetical protein
MSQHCDQEGVSHCGQCAKQALAIRANCRDRQCLYNVSEDCKPELFILGWKLLP